VEHSKAMFAGISCGATLLIAGVAAADPIAIVTTPENPSQTVGTDTMNQVMDIIGFVPIDDPICVGSQATAGCGAPTLQPKEACFPQ